jgi:putative SOS response-associated peptidase YedK
MVGLARRRSGGRNGIELKSLLAPYPAAEMICWPVSARVGNVRNNDASLIEPLVAMAH